MARTLADLIEAARIARTPADGPEPVAMKSDRHPAIKLRGKIFVAVGRHADALRLAVTDIAGNVEDALLDLETAIDDGIEPIEIGYARMDGDGFVTCRSAIAQSVPADGPADAVSEADVDLETAQRARK